MSDMNQLKSQYERLNGLRPAEAAYLRSLESDLGVSLPRDFLSATEFFDGSGVAVLPLHAIARNPAINVLSETKRLRASIGLPEKFLVLGEPSESLLVLDCSDGRVIWCDAIDAPRLGKEPLARDPETWAAYSDFLAYLLDEEENDRA
jgi:SMI1-KNR4 cell-wall